MKPLRTAVIGTGHLGRIHARLAAESPHIDLVAVVDVNAEARDRVAAEVGTRGVADYRELKGQIEGAIVATPTIHHYRVVKELLSAGIHVLVEKPITATVAEADDLVRDADRRNLTLQVGHVERFNPGLECVADRLSDVRFMQATRASGFTFRSTDIGVVMDLMIHDIDVVLSIAHSPVTAVSALGFSVMGDQEDIAQAQLQFANGCVAQLTASRVSYTPMRSLQVFSSQGHACVDFASRNATVVEPREDLLRREFRIDDLDDQQRAHYRDHLFEELLAKRTIEPEATNAIAQEHIDFAESVRTGRPPRVSGRAGRDALAVAERILDSIASHAWDGTPTGRRGSLGVTGTPVLGGIDHLRKAG